MAEGAGDLRRIHHRQPADIAALTALGPGLEWVHAFQEASHETKRAVDGVCCVWQGAVGVLAERWGRSPDFKQLGPTVEESVDGIKLMSCAGSAGKDIS